MHETIRRLTEGHDHPHIVYLGSLDGQNRYGADLLRVQSFSKDWKECFRKKRWKTLTTAGLLYVQARLSFHAGRLATEQGFWHQLPEDNECADSTAKDPSVFDKAKIRLDEKLLGKSPNK